jgi:hypothetical protein
MKKLDKHFIHPEDRENLNYWTKKLGVSLYRLNEAILYTGSLRPENIKSYLRKDSWFYHPMLGLKAFYKTTVNFIF